MEKGVNINQKTNINEAQADVHSTGKITYPRILFFFLNVLVPSPVIDMTFLPWI